MKTKRTISYLLLALILILSLSGCSKKGKNKYGQDISNRNITKIEAILKQPSNFENKTVTVQGQIVRQCPAGCWFEAKENSGILYIDLNPSAFAIPQKVGKKIVVEGKVLLKANQPMLIGTGVEIK